MAKVRLSAQAVRSLSAQASYLRSRNPLAADRLLADIGRVLDLLSEQPLAGPPVPGRPYRYFITRRYRYRLTYQVRDKNVEILDILHPRQQP